MSGPHPVKPPSNPTVTPKVSMLSLYAGLCFCAAFLIVKEGWPHVWAAAAVVPVGIGAVLLRKAGVAAREARDEWLDSEDE
jgi:hypothetical protein